MTANFRIRQFLTPYLSRDHATSAAHLGTILDWLEALDLAPETMSFSDEPAHRYYRVPYDPQFLRQYVLETPGLLMPIFYRAAAPASTFSPGFVSEGLMYNSCAIRFENVELHRRAQLGTLASRMASVTRPLFGGIGFPWTDTTEEARRFNAMLNTGGLDLHNNGPDSAAVRSWFGPPFAAQLDPAALTALDLVVRTTDWGGLEVDLTDEPWNAPLELLAAQKQAFNGYLSDLGLLGDYSRRLLRRPGARWAQVKAHLP
ncbi:hypothetical protein [Deinococcus sedimenti]|uniref:DUF3396 domain-containing protein n=1 Tax=Deinococcus sedimenti TaxID=1867090 RepID=A0ABQ2RXX7_9DEIO|nr:hypothetical protein [Deinococcus sedimenti]GGR79429.1 hypothetical protein GCM10008960_02840 [Deinococcus sedimenti]